MKNKVPSTINMLDEFQDTPTPDSQASTIKSLNYINETKPKMPWGRLYATIKNLESFGKQCQSLLLKETTKVNLTLQICKRKAMFLVEILTAM